MEKINFPRQYKVYLPLAALFVMMVFLMPRNARFNYDYRKGSPWMYETLVSQFDFPILKTDQQIMAERDKVGSEFIPYYRYEARVGTSIQDALSAIELGDCSYTRSAMASALASIYSKGVLSSVLDDANSSDDIIYVQKRTVVRVEKGISPKTLVGKDGSLSDFWTYVFCGNLSGIQPFD